MSALRDSEEALLKQAIDYACGDVADHDAKKALFLAADNYARVRWAMATAGRTKTPKARSGFTMPFGRSKGLAIEDAQRSDVEWMLSKIEQDIDDPEKARFRAKNVAFRDALDAELASRRK